jgi:peptidoglycan/LPS O-acetylase OafA/YrhL
LWLLNRASCTDTASARPFAFANAGRPFMLLLNEPGPGPRTNQIMQKRDAYRPDIDGLRALSISLVLGFHAFPDFIPGGFIGVDLFFVISGYLISGIIYARLAEGTFTLAAFYGRRIRRIFPALIIVLAVCLIVGWYVLLPQEYILLGKQVASSALFVSNIYFWTHSGYFDPSASSYALLNLWSLGVEEQFYIVWPLLLMLLWRRTQFVPYAIFGLAVISFTVWAVTRTAGFYSPLARTWELMIGAGLAWRQGFALPRPRHANLATTVGLVAILLAGLIVHPVVSWRTLLSTLGGGLVLWSAPGSRIGKALLSNRAVVAIGLISYPLYLWHWPVLWVTHRLEPRSTTWMILLACALSIILASGTYLLVELPLRRRHEKRPSQTIAALVAANVLLLVGGFGVVVRTGFPSRFDLNEVMLGTYASSRFFDQKELYQVGRCFLLPNQPPSTFAPECGGTHDGRPQVLLWGDSAAAALHPGMAAIQTHFDIQLYSSSACPPLLPPYAPQIIHEPQIGLPWCTATNADILERIRAAKPEFVVLSMAPNYVGDLPSLLGAAVEELKRIGVSHVMVVGPPPLWNEAVSQIILRAYLAAKPRVLPQQIQMDANANASAHKFDHEARTAVEQADGQYLSVLDRLCDQSGRCTAMIGGKPYAFDGFHLAQAASAFVAEDIYARLLALQNMQKPELKSTP